MPNGKPQNEGIVILSLAMAESSLMAKGDVIVVYDKDKDELELISIVQSLEAIGFQVTKDFK